MQQGADDTKANLLRSQDRLFDDVDGNCHRQIEEDGDSGEQPDELRPAVDLIHHQGPGGVAERGGEDESEGEGESENEGKDEDKGENRR